MLEITNLGFYYQEGNWLFRHLDFMVETGEIIGVQAPSGYGKSTLARIIAGYQAGIEGQVKLHNSPISTKGYYPIQLIHQHPELTMNPRWQMGKILHEGWQVPESLQNKFGIQKEWYHRYPNEISGGEKQRFALLRSLGPKTQYIIADEMTTMLDAVSQVIIWQNLLREVRARNIGMLIISHDEILLKRITDRIVFLQDYE